MIQLLCYYKGYSYSRKNNTILIAWAQQSLRGPPMKISRKRQNSTLKNLCVSSGSVQPLTYQSCWEVMCPSVINVDILKKVVHPRRKNKYVLNHHKSCFSSTQCICKKVAVISCTQQTIRRERIIKGKKTTSVCKLIFFCNISTQRCLVIITN